MDEKKMRVAITHGDINGVGYEMILKAFEDSTLLELCTPIIYGSSKIANYYIKVYGLENLKFNIINQANQAKAGNVNLLECCGEEDIPVTPGVPTVESGRAAMQAIQRAIDDYKDGAFDVLVTAPVNRSTMENFNGHSDYLERRLELGKKGLSILMNEDFRVAMVTNNLAIKDISESITKQKIVEKGLLFSETLRRDLRISSPRIAVLSLNPRCGEDGALGDEEQEIIIPAIKEMEEKGIQAFGPYAADNFFGQGDYYRFDGVLAMYHDQGMTPFKTLSPEEGVRFTGGLPIIRTAPAIAAISGTMEHHTPEKDAIRSQANANSLRQAIYVAIDVLRNRTNYDEPLANPLPKLYHERRDDSEKVRFRSSNNEGGKENSVPAAQKNNKENKN